MEPVDCASEEWRWLVNEKLQDNSLWLRPVVRSPTPAQRTLQNQLNEACSKLLADLGQFIVASIVVDYAALITLAYQGSF